MGIREREKEMGKKMDTAKQLAITYLIKNTNYSENVLKNKSIKGIFNLMKIKYSDGTIPKTPREKGHAIISWSNTMNKIVDRPYSQNIDNKQEKTIVSRRMVWREVEK